MSQSVRPWLAVFGLGGTIAMTQAPDGGVSPALSAADLLGAVPGLSGVEAELRTVDFRRKPGASLSFTDLFELADAISDAFRNGCTGVVVTQGTDTIEEVAYALDLLLPADAPVVVTGAMRNPTMAGADGPANILAAARVAASRSARGLGCLVVLNDQIHAARWVQKTHTASTAAFASPGHGPLGDVFEGRVHSHRPPAPVTGHPPRPSQERAHRHRDGRPRRRRHARRGDGGARRRAGDSCPRRGSRPGRRRARPWPAHGAYPGGAGLPDRRWPGARPHLQLPRFRTRPADARAHQRWLPGPAQGAHPASAADRVGSRYRANPQNLRAGRRT